MSGIQYRPKDAGADAPKYAPERDLAHIGHTLLRSAIDRIDPANWNAELKVWAKEQGFEPEDVLEAVRCLGASQAHYVSGNPNIKTPLQALQACGFDKVPPPVQMLLFASIGQSVAGAWMFAVRELTLVGDAPPMQSGISELVVAANSIAAGSRRKAYPKAGTAEALETARAELQAAGLRIKDLEQQTVHLTNVIAGNQEAAKEYERLFDVENRKRLGLEQQLADEHLALHKMTFWAHVRAWWAKVFPFEIGD